MYLLRYRILWLHSKDTKGRSVRSFIACVALFDHHRRKILCPVYATPGVHKLCYYWFWHQWEYCQKLWTNSCRCRFTHALKSGIFKWLTLARCLSDIRHSRLAYTNFLNLVRSPELEASSRAYRAIGSTISGARGTRHGERRVKFFARTIRIMLTE